MTNHWNQKVPSVSTTDRRRSANPILDAGSVLGGVKSIIGCRAAHLSHIGIVPCIFHFYFQAVIIFSHLLFYRKDSLNFD